MDKVELIWALQDGAFHGTLAGVIKMERILLIEPNYKNKYPPIGLMKISTYFKNKGDFVQFHKGLLPQMETSTFDKVFVTTLFTFDFEMCVQTIKYYIAIVGSANVYVGGIAATIMPEKFIEAIPNINLLKGQMTSSKMMGYADDINIDILELDYDILWDVSYEYPAADSYFIYTSRGCPRKCSFCAVKTLEPTFYDCDNIVQQVQRVDECFGIKKNLLIMDNNILYSEHFEDTIDELINLGFDNKNNKVKKCNTMKYYIKSLAARVKEGRKKESLLARIRKELNGIKYSRISNKDSALLKVVCEDLEKLSDDVLIERLFANREFLEDFFERYHYHKVSRYVDFNQGLDARLFTEEKAKKMAQIAIKPCRIAFDDLNIQKDYFDAMERAVKFGITHFSNYLLYNYKETPEELWKRLHLNIQFCKKHADKGINLFSFPMKYASIEHTNRDYVGQYWHKKYLRAINVILNVTSGVVAKEDDFFYRAYGKSAEEFIEILTMPDDFIRFRDFFEKNVFSQMWKKHYIALSINDKRDLLEILDKMIEEPEVLDMHYNDNIDAILKFYTVRKTKVEKNEIYYKNLLLKLSL